MKRCVIILLGLIFCFCARAETKNITLTFNESDFVFNNNNDTLSIDSYIHTLIFDNDTTAPAIPQIPVNIIINDNLEYDSVTYSYTETLIRENVYIFPNQKEVPTNRINVNSSSIYSYDSVLFPYSNVEYSGCNIIDGSKIISFLVSPFRYDAVSKRLYLLSSIDIDIILANGDNPITTTAKRMKQSITDMVYNKNEVVGEMSSNYDYEYIIVTCDSLKSCFQKLADWKTIKGVKSKVITVEEIYNQYTGNTPQQRIKKALKDYYNGNYTGLKYVLLGGDVEIVPAQKCCVKYSIYDSITASDIYYICFDDINWDTNNNNRFAEISDNIDLGQDAIISRLPVNTQEDACNVVNRIIEYEFFPKTNNWVNNLLMAGYYYGEYKGNYATSYEIGNETYEEYIQPYWDCQRFRLHEAYSDHPTNVNYYCNPLNLENELYKGYKFAYMISHGYEDYWVLENPFRYNKNQADNLKNKSYTNIVTVACHTNDFIEECLGESFINNKDGGIISYLGSSQFGWTTTSHVFIQYFFKKLLNSSSQQIGKALYDTKNIFISNISNNSTHRWLYLSMNLLGDPELPVYLSYPKRFYNVNIEFNNGNLSINTGVSGCRICISSLNDNNFYIVENGIRTLELENFNKDCYICITKPGYIPYIARVGDIAYIQNQILEGNNDIYSIQTYIGNNVTNQQEPGNVIVENGKTTITHTNGVHITNGFTVKNGAEFIIIKQ